MPLQRRMVLNIAKNMVTFGECYACIRVLCLYNFAIYVEVHLIDENKSVIKSFIFQLFLHCQTIDVGRRSFLLTLLIDSRGLHSKAVQTRSTVSSEVEGRPLLDTKPIHHEFAMLSQYRFPFWCLLSDFWAECILNKCP